MFVLISDIAACEAHNNGKLTMYLPTRPLNYNVKYSYRLFANWCVDKIKLERMCVINKIIRVWKMRINMNDDKTK